MKWTRRGVVFRLGLEKHQAIEAEGWPWSSADGIQPNGTMRAHFQGVGLRLFAHRCCSSIWILLSLLPSKFFPRHCLPF
jgi:hypothetical protein